MPRSHAILLLLIVLAIGCAGHGRIVPQEKDPSLTQGEAFATVQGDRFLGAIIPADRVDDQNYFFGDWDGFWTPSANDVGSLEEGLASALTDAGCDPYIHEHLASYRRQYVGVIVDGRRRILVNAFRFWEDEEPESHYYWLHQYVFVNDGGHYYWRIQFDMHTKRYLEFDQNGYA
jgi:hypothetical protein